jgi:hypothetical protein
MIGRAAKTVVRHARQRVRPSRKVCPFCFEADHIGGRNHIPHVIVDVCQAHHALITEQRLAAGADMKQQPHTIKTVEMAIRSLAVTGRAITSAMEKLCEALEFCADMLKRARRR